MRGLPPDIREFLETNARATGLTLEAYTRWLVVDAVMYRKSAAKAWPAKLDRKAADAVIPPNPGA